MEKIKKLFSNISNLIKNTFKKFPVTMIIVYFTTILCAFGTDDFVEAFIDDLWFYAMGVWIIGTLFSENFFKNKYILGIGHIISLIIAFVFRDFLMDENYSSNFSLMKIIMTYMSVVPLITVYKILKDTGVSVKAFAIRVLGNISKTTAIYALANLGIIVVILVFSELILDGNDFDLLPRTLILLLGGFYVPAMINSITEVKNETGKFMKILLTAILMPVALFLIGTLYLYVIKIIINGELLNKSLFFILSLTFTLSIPGVILLRNYDNNKAVFVISNILFYAFIPLLILQIIAMNVRVSDYGLTESRYMGYLLIAFEIIFIALMMIKNSKYLDKIILVFAGFIIWGALTPFNVFDVPVYSQTTRITAMLNTVEKFDDLSDEQKNECKKALRYVKNSYMPEYLDKKLTKEQQEEIENYVVKYKDVTKYEYVGDYDYEYLSMYNTAENIDIKEFSKLYEVHSDYSYYEDIDVNKYELTDNSETIKVTADLENFIIQMYKAEKENRKKEVFENLRYIKTSDENVVFCIISFSLKYETYTNKLDRISVEGYLLVK